MQAIIISKTGDSGVLKVKTVDDPKPGKNQVVVRNTAIGVNYLDVCLRRGQYKVPETPTILGFEACGIIESIGSNVKNFKPGERVAYATGGMGAYAEKKVVNQDFLIAVPNNISDVQVAGSLLKGLMAHTLLFRVFLVRRVKRILVHAAAGGVGQFLCQWAHHMGVEVIGTVGSDIKMGYAKGNGCYEVINYRNKNFVEEVEKITNGKGVGIVYDSVGKDTLLKSLDCLWPFGLCVSYGESSGKTEPLDLNHLVENSLYLTRPTLAMYKGTRVELALAANEVFELLGKNILRPKITTFSFKDVVKAHKSLESRDSSGSIVLTV